MNGLLMKNMFVSLLVCRRSTLNCQKTKKYAHVSGVPIVYSVAYAYTYTYTYFLTLRDIIILGVSCYNSFSFLL
jgi:hypothetical protein